MFLGRYYKIIAVFAGILCFSSGDPLGAVQVYGTNGTGISYTTAPSDDFGFANVGQVFDTTDHFYTSGVYLRNGWMLSAYHEVRSGSNGFAFGNVLLDGIIYGVNASTAVRILDPITQTPVDLAMYQLTTLPTDPALTTVVISATTPAVSSNLILIGNGFNRAESLTYWTDSWIETNGIGYTYSGYLYGAGQSMRWGTGTLSGTTSTDDGYGVTSFFNSTFQSATGSAMGAPGDSGGGVFYKNGSEWELSGIMLSIDTYPGQPIFSTSAFGNKTEAADLAYYSSQINSVMAISPGYSAWANGLFGAQFTNPAVSEPAATPQNDGISNALKYFCDINPTIPMSNADREALPVAGFTTVNGTAYLTLTYRQNPNITGLTVSVQTCLDLQTWTNVTPDSTKTIGTDSLTGDPIIQREIQINGNSKLFLRLQITVPSRGP